MEKSLFNPHQKPRPFKIEAARRNAVNRILVMLFALLLIPQDLLAQVPPEHSTSYDLWIGGIRVTSSNYGDLAAAAVQLGKSDSVVVSSGGSISFDRSTNTLNLKNVELKRRITSGLSSLKIKFEGTCKVNSDSRLTGNGNVVSKQENAILSTYNVGGTKAALSFEKSGDGTLELDGKEYNPAVIGFASVSYGSGCYMKAAVPTLYDPAQGYVNFGLTGNKTDVVMITSDVTYPLWVQGIQVDDNNAANVFKEPTGNPTVVFDSSNNTLKLNEANISGKIQSALGDLVVSVSGVNTITADSGSLIRSANGSCLTIKKEESHATLALKIDDATSIYPVIQGFETLSYTTDFDLNTSATEPKYGDFNLTITGASSVQVKGLYDDAVSGKTAILSATFVKKYDLWVGGTQVTSANLDNIGPSGTDFSFDPDESTLHYRDGGSTSYSVHSGLPNLTIKIGTPSSSDPTNYSINNISTIKFGSPNGEPVAAASGTLTLSKEDNFAGIQQFDIVAYGSEPSLIQGFDDVTYSDFVIMQDGAVYNTTTKQLEYPNPSGSGYVGLDATTTFRTPQDISGFYVADIPNQDYTGSPLNANITVKETETAATALVENTDYTVSYQLAGAAATPQDAKTYNVIITGKGLYTGSITAKTFTIDPASATITAANQTVTYNGAAQAISGVSVDKGSVSITYYDSAADRAANTKGYTTAPTNAGTYYVQVTQSDANYTSTPVDVTFTIGAKSLTDATIMVDAISSQTYNDGTAITPAVVVKDGGKPLAASTDYTLNYSNNTDAALSTDASAPTVKITGTGNYTGEKTVKFTISPASATITATDQTVTYNGAAQAISGVLVDKGTISITYYNSSDDRSAKTGGTTTAPTNADTYYVQVTQTDANYTSTPMDVTFNIDSLEVKLSWSNTSLTYNGAAQKPTATVTNLIGSDVCDVIVSGEQTDAGSHTATVIGLSNRNYKMPTTGLSETFTINAAPGTMTSPTALTLTYTGAEQNLVNAGSSTNGTVEYKLSDDDETKWGTTIPKKKDAGTYTVNYRLKGDSNHDDIASADLQVTIAPAIAALSWSNTSLTYNGAAQKPTATVTNLIGSDACTVTVSGEQTNAGSYTATASGLSNTNYTLPAAASENFTIAPAIAALSWSNTSLTYNGAAQKPTATVTNLIGSDACTVTVSGEQTNAGSYTATASGLSNTNYTLPAAASENFTIAPAIAALSWSNTSLTYNGAAQKPTATVTNLIGSDACTVTVSGEQTNAGSYTATASGLSNTNYTLPAAASENFTIAPAIAALSWSNTPLTYNGAAQKPTATVTNLIGSDACTVTVSGEQTNAGSYTATASGLSNTNYTLPAAASENFTIAPAIAALSWSNTSLTYNGAAQKPTATVTNLIGSDACTVTVSGEQTNAGSYTATASGLSNTNYTLPAAASENFTIAPAIAALSWSNTSLTYNGAAQKPTATVTNLIGSDACTVTVSGEQTDAGSYTATASGLSNTNYTLPATGLTQNFTISDRTATIAFKTGRTYQTFYAANETFLVPDGVTAYIVTGVNGKSVTVTKVSYIPAAEPVLLESTPGSTIAKDPSETIAGNLLRYAAKSVAADGNQYVLYSDEFVKASGNINGKVYLDLTGLPSPARTFVIRTENATSIEDVFSEEADGDAKWYDMQGRRINKPTKAGLYIKDGKKVVVNKK